MNERTVDYEIPKIPACKARQSSPLDAWRSLRALMRDPDDTERAFDFFYAVDAAGFERNFQRFVRHPGGRKLLVERPHLGALLSDRSWLATVAPSSFGAAYLALMDRNGLDPLGLIDIERTVEERWALKLETPRLDPIRAWYRDRFVLVHDLLHVLTGYGTDELGEAALLAFTHAQVGGRAYALLTVASSLKAARVQGRSWLSSAARAAGSLDSRAALRGALTTSPRDRALHRGHRERGNLPSLRHSLRRFEREWHRPPRAPDVEQ